MIEKAKTSVGKGGKKKKGEIKNNFREKIVHYRHPGFQKHGCNGQK